ncbi:MAG: glycosyltransferase family 4 protein [Planctomycetota bacterium]|jgi:glycosyltransferase involved in cell wall biosynthesis
MNQKIKILMLNYEFPPIGGGAGKANLCLLKEYTNNSQLSIDVLTSAPKPGSTQEQLGENINIYKAGVHKKNLHYWRKSEVIEWLLKAQFHYRKLLRENDYDLVHAFFGFPTAWLCYRTANKLPYIISLRGSDVPGYNIRLGLDYKLMSGLFRKIWSSAAEVVANSNGLQQLANKFMPDLNISVIPNGVDTTRFYPPDTKKTGDRLKLLTVSRLISRKRLDLLLEATKQANELGANVELNIAGEGNLMKQLKKSAKQFGIAEQVHFMGRIPSEKMPEIYRDNDVFVMSSLHEGMCNAMLEAMASGLPIITTRCEGVEELINDNGIVVEKAQSDEIAKAINKLTTDQQAYKQMSVAARQRAEKFSWKNVAHQYTQLYDKTLHKED